MKERVGGRQRSLFFLPVFSCREIPLIAGKALTLCQSKFLAPEKLASQFSYLGQSILSAQLINVHFCYLVCATLITRVCLFFYQTGTDLSSSQSRFVSYVRSVFNLVAKILGPVEQARLG